MNDYTVRATTTWIQQSIKSTSDPRNGDTTTITGTATTQAEAVTKALYYRNNGWSVSVEQQGKADLWTVSATYNADTITDPSDARIPDITWEVMPHMYEQNILDITDREWAKDLSPTTKTLIEAACKQGNKDGNPVLTTVGDIKQLPHAKLAYNLKVRGLDSRQSFTTGVKRSVIVSTRFNIDWSLTNNDKVLSKNVLIHNYFVPLWVARLLPDSDETIQTDSGGFDYFYGYLETQPTYQGVAGNRVQISQEWIYNQWSAGTNGLYDVVT
jgi:hypothetical protein